MNAHESVSAINKFNANFTFYIAEGFSRILLYLNSDFKPSVA